MQPLPTIHASHLWTICNDLRPFSTCFRVPFLRTLRVGEKGTDYVVECAGTEQALNDAIMMTNRGGKICLAAFPHKPVEINIPHMVLCKLLTLI